MSSSMGRTSMRLSRIDVARQPQLKLLSPAFRPRYCPPTSRCLHQLQSRPRLSSKRLSIHSQSQTRSQTQYKVGTRLHLLQWLMRKHPITMTAALSIIVLGCAGLVYVNYIYKSYIIDGFSRFPEPVAKELRKALYFTNYNVQPKHALKHYKRAVNAAEDLGMDPFSDEMLGIKIQVAAFMEKIEQYNKAIEVLEVLKTDCQKWMDLLGSKDENVGKRTRVLGKMVGINVKLGELYADPHVNNASKAQENLVWAVETVLKEEMRRQNEGIKEGEGDWMSPEQIGGALEALAHKYEEQNLHYLATPLFLHALTLCPPKSCHATVLMNNLAISLAQQLPPTKADEKAPSRKELVSNARQWAQKALLLSQSIVPPERTEECDYGCAVATHNLGEFAEMDGNVAEARKQYEEAKALAKAIGFDEGVHQADEGLSRLKLK